MHLPELRLGAGQPALDQFIQDNRLRLVGFQEYRRMNVDPDEHQARVVRGAVTRIPSVSIARHTAGCLPVSADRGHPTFNGRERLSLAHEAAWEDIHHAAAPQFRRDAGYCRGAVTRVSRRSVSPLRAAGQELRRSSGSVKWNVVPTPTWLSAQICPPCASTIHCEI